MQNVTILKSPLVQDSLTRLRDKSTSTQQFRLHAEKIASMLIATACDDLKTTEKNIETPITSMQGTYLTADIILVTILRAGLAMLGPAIKCFPDAPIGLAGLTRDEKTAIAKEYYWQMPEITKNSIIFLFDPMLATGGSLSHVLERMREAREVRVITIISAPEGIAAVNKAFPNSKIVTAAVDEKLNDQKFIVPGLGDFGDRYFGTK